MRARYYNPTIQRFINVDPIKNGNNWYGYASGNSISNIDPTGYMDWKKQGSVFKDGMFDAMCDFRASVDKEFGKLISNPIGYLADKANYVKQDIDNLFTEVKNGDITPISIIKGGIDWTTKTVKGIYDWSYKLSPFIDISDEEAYQLGYDGTKATIDTSVFIVKSAITYKAISSLGKLGSKLFSKIKTKSGKNFGKWDMIEGGGVINGREYSQHAMERMAPNTPQVRAELSRRAEKVAEQLGYKLGTKKYYEVCKKYVDPRNIPPSVIEDAIISTKPVVGKTTNTFIYETEDVKVIVNANGKVVTVIPK